MKNFLFLGLLILLFASHIVVAENEGWYKTKWKMTVEEVSTVLNHKIIQVHEQDRKKFKNEYQYTLSDFKIGDYVFNIYFLFDSNNGLSEVFITKNTGDDSYNCFLYLEDSLKKKYSTPTSLRDDDDTKMGTLAHFREWQTQTSIIKLANISLFFAGKTNHTTTLIYSARKIEDDKF